MVCRSCARGEAQEGNLQAGFQGQPVAGAFTRQPPEGVPVLLRPGFSRLMLPPDHALAAAGKAGQDFCAPSPLRTTGPFRAP